MGGGWECARSHFGPWPSAARCHRPAPGSRPRVHRSRYHRPIHHRRYRTSGRLHVPLELRHGDQTASAGCCRDAIRREGNALDPHAPATRLSFGRRAARSTDLVRRVNVRLPRADSPNWTGSGSERCVAPAPGVPPHAFGSPGTRRVASRPIRIARLPHRNPQTAVLSAPVRARHPRWLVAWSCHHHRDRRSRRTCPCPAGARTGPYRA